MEQLHLERAFRAKAPIPVDGIKDPSGHVEYWGLASQEWDGTWRCYANVDGKMCVVQVKVTALKEHEAEKVDK